MTASTTTDWICSVLSAPTITDWITAFCALAGVAAAFAWRRSLLGAKRIEAEQENYAAATDVLYSLYALNEARNFLAEHEEDHSDTKAWVEVLLDPRLSEGNEHSTKLLAAEKKAALYLDKETRGLLREISDLWVRYGMVALRVLPLALRQQATSQEILETWDSELSKLVAPLGEAQAQDRVKALNDRVKKRFERRA